MAKKPTAAFILSLIGAVLIILIALSVMMMGFPHIFLSIVILIEGIVILMGASMINSENEIRVNLGSAIVLLYPISFIGVGSSIFSVSFIAGIGFIIGSLLCLVGSILGLKWKPPLPEAPPPLAGEPVPAKLVCKYCGAENPFYLIYCKNCGSKIGGVGEPESAGTQVKPTDAEKELALLEERLAKLEELYRSGEIEEEAYKRLKEEYENRKRELEKRVNKQG